MMIIDLSRNDELFDKHELYAVLSKMSMLPSIRGKIDMVSM